MKQVRVMNKKTSETDAQHSEQNWWIRWVKLMNETTNETDEEADKYAQARLMRRVRMVN